MHFESIAFFEKKPRNFPFFSSADFAFDRIDEILPSRPVCAAPSSYVNH